MPSITLLGPGAIGATLATWLAQAPHNTVTVAARTPFDRLEVTTPDGVMCATPRILLDRTQARPTDWVLVTTKAYDSAAAARWFDTACGPQTRVAVIQNGTEHVARFAPYLPRERILPVVIDCPADRTAPGRVTLRGPINMVVPTGVNGASFAELFAGLKVNLQQTEDFTTALWQKLCLNSAGAVCAVTLQPSGIAHHDGVADIMRAIVRECVAVGRAQGARLDDSIVDEIVERTRRAPRDAGNSILADRRAGRPMEYDARNGVIVRLGIEHKIATPMNALMVALLEGIQSS
jgi:2-dehydropantoate 2-reductase